MKIQKAKSFGLGPGHFIFIWDRTDRPILLLAGFPFLSGRGNIVSRAPRKYHNCWSARCDCLFFLLSISIFFASSTDKWNCCWCDFLLSVCAYSPFSCSRMGHWALVFSCWAARYTHVWTIARIPRVGSCCVRVELWKGKNFRRQHVFAWQTFSLSLSFSPFWLLHFLSPSCEYNAVPTGSKLNAISNVCLSKNPGWNEYQKQPGKRAELWNETTNPFHHSLLLPSCPVKQPQPLSLYMFSYIG